MSNSSQERAGCEIEKLKIMVDRKEKLLERSRVKMTPAQCGGGFGKPNTNMKEHRQ